MSFPGAIAERIAAAMSGKPPPQLPPKHSNLCPIWVADPVIAKVCAYCALPERSHTDRARANGVPPAGRPFDEQARSVAAQVSDDA